MAASAGPAALPSIAVMAGMSGTWCGPAARFRAGERGATMRTPGKSGARQAMSKKDRKIKKLKREVKELRAQLRKLKAASARRRRTRVAKALNSLPKPTPKPRPKPPIAAPARGNVDTPAEMSIALKSISAVRTAGQR
jgi:hypothetical protein